MNRCVPRALIVLGLIGAAGCQAARGNGLPTVTPPPGEAWLPSEQAARIVVVAPVAQHEVGGDIAASGKIAFDDLRVSHIYSPVSGRITRLLAAPGQRVKKGAPLAVIQSPDVGSAFSDLGKAQADLVASEHELKRQRELYEAHAGAQRDLEAAEDNDGKAKAEMDRAQQKARLLRRGALNRVTQEYTLPAPIDGEVIARMANPGQEVQGQYSGGSAVELFTIGELDSVWALADVYEMDLARIKEGQPVTVRVTAYPTQPFKGAVDWVAGSLDPATRTAKVRCAIANGARRLKPEMYASVDILATGREALAVARSAVLRQGDQRIVFVERAGGPPGNRSFARRAVTIDDEVDGDLVPVLQGLVPGERVVVSGGIELLGAL